MSAAGLDHVSHVPPQARDGTPVAVLLHGRGSDMRDLQGLQRLLPEGMPLVTPQAPHPGLPWGYGPGWAWYRYVAEDRVEGASLEASLAALDAFLDGLPSILPVRPGPVVLGGFSQGGTVSLAYALRRPGKVAAVLNFSGFLLHDSLLDVTAEAAAATPVFWGHGIHDPAIPHALGERGRTRLRAAGADVTTSDPPIGHWIDPQEMREAVAWVGERVGG
ncbi:MAG TPA: alpha/beta fold hydrolase [Longimicrobiales bacterium]